MTRSREDIELEIVGMLRAQARNLGATGEELDSVRRNYDKDGDNMLGLILGLTRGNNAKWWKK